MHSIYTWLPHLISTVAMAVALGTLLYFRLRGANVALISKLRGEIADTQADLADLRDRFTRFQKREGMRAAREEKASAQSLREQAYSILAGGGDGAAGAVPGDDSKAALYRKFRQ